MNQWSIREVGKRKEGRGPGQFEFLAYAPPPRPRTKSKVPEEKRRNIRRLILQFLQFFRPVTVEPFRIWVKYKTNHVCWTIPEQMIFLSGLWVSLTFGWNFADTGWWWYQLNTRWGHQGLQQGGAGFAWNVGVGVCLATMYVVWPLGRWRLTLRWRGMSRITRSCTRWEGWSDKSAVTGVHIRFSCRNNPSFRLNTQ